MRVYVLLGAFFWADLTECNTGWKRLLSADGLVAEFT